MTELIEYKTLKRSTRGQDQTGREGGEKRKTICAGENVCERERRYV